MLRQKYDFEMFPVSALEKARGNIRPQLFEDENTALTGERFSFQIAYRSIGVQRSDLSYRLEGGKGKRAGLSCAGYALFISRIGGSRRLCLRECALHDAGLAGPCFSLRNHRKMRGLTIFLYRTHRPAGGRIPAHICRSRSGGVDDCGDGLSSARSGRKTSGRRSHLCLLAALRLHSGILRPAVSFGRL